MTIEFTIGSSIGLGFVVFIYLLLRKKNARVLQGIVTAVLPTSFNKMGTYYPIITVKENDQVLTVIEARHMIRNQGMVRNGDTFKIYEIKNSTGYEYEPEAGYFRMVLYIMIVPWFIFILSTLW